MSFTGRYFYDIQLAIQEHVMLQHGADVSLTSLHRVVVDERKVADQPTDVTTVAQRMVEAGLLVGLFRGMNEFYGVRENIDG